MRNWETVNANRALDRAPSGPVSWSWRRAAPEGRRRLSNAERRAIRARREARTEPLDGVSDESAPSRPVPRMPKTRQDTRVRSPGITLAGALLILGLTVLAFAGGRLFGRADDPSLAAQPEAPPVVVETPAVVAVSAPEVVPPEETPIPLPASFVRAPVVCLDPGHGGSDRGFTRFFDDGVPAMEEAILVLEHAWDLEARLQQRGYEVVMTRETDAELNLEGKDVNGDGRTAAHDPPRSDRNKNLDELQARINLCNKAGADLLVSMHVNGYSNGNPRGYETWFTRERSFGDRNAVFATLAYAHLKEQLGYIGYHLPAEEERGVMADTTADVQKEHSLFKHFIMTGPAVPGVVVPSKMPGAIVEALFVSNDGDAAILSTPEGRAAIVTAYENAIVEYFERYPPEAR
jgi:N-acetylmuramoyl-L-alanine amidase